MRHHPRSEQRKSSGTPDQSRRHRPVEEDYFRLADGETEHYFGGVDIIEAIFADNRREEQLRRHHHRRPMRN